MNKCRPPKLPYRFFRWYCHPDYLEDIEGDLLERYERNTLQAGQKEANWQFIKDVLKLFRPGIIKPIVKTQRINHIELIRNNLKLGFRHLLKRKGYAFINTLGLAVGFASTLLITLYVQNELSYDTHFSHADRTFKMVQKISSPDGEEMLPIVPYSLVNIVKDNYAEVEGGTAVSGPYNSQVVTVKGAQGQTSNFVENGALLADSNFFSVFSYEMISGNAKTALKEPHSVYPTAQCTDPEGPNLQRIVLLYFLSGLHCVVLLKPFWHCHLSFHN
ncbi:MAG: permease prefix domain 2-containing transporter, partial [Bacteroidota bacterium]